MRRPGEEDRRGGEESKGVEERRRGEKDSEEERRRQKRRRRQCEGEEAGRTKEEMSLPDRGPSSLQPISLELAMDVIHWVTISAALATITRVDPLCLYTSKHTLSWQQSLPSASVPLDAIC